MVGASKILTVSYGTFSCTLEGFDDPFNTMKAIAEYFRDLAAGDRYFGATPPTPDAEMLHRIAEREVRLPVEARVSDHGIVLRAGNGAGDGPAAAIAAPFSAAPAAPPAASAMHPTTATSVAALAAASAPIAARAAEALAQEDDGIEPEPEADTVFAPVEGPVPATSGEAGIGDDMGDVAAKLSRIRAVIAAAQAAKEAPAAQAAKEAPEAPAAATPVTVFEEEDDILSAEPAEEPAGMAPVTEEPVAEEPVTEGPAAVEPEAEAAGFDFAASVDDDFGFDLDLGDLPVARQSDPTPSEADLAETPDAGTTPVESTVAAAAAPEFIEPEAMEPEAMEPETEAFAAATEGASEPVLEEAPIEAPIEAMIDLTGGEAAELDATEAENAEDTAEEIAAIEAAVSDAVTATGFLAEHAGDEADEDEDFAALAIATVMGAHGEATAGTADTKEAEAFAADPFDAGPFGADDSEEDAAEARDEGLGVLDLAGWRLDSDEDEEAEEAEEPDAAAVDTAAEVEAEAAEAEADADADASRPAERRPSFFERARARVVKIRRGALTDEAVTGGSGTETPLAPEAAEAAPETGAFAAETAADDEAAREEADHAAIFAALNAVEATGADFEDDLAESAADLEIAEDITETAEDLGVTEDETLAAVSDEADDIMLAGIGAAIGAAQPEAEADEALSRDIAAIARDARRDAHEGRAILEDQAGDGDASMERLMEEAKSKLEGDESRRRFSAISHLKAAVAATVADRKLKSQEIPTGDAVAPEEDIDRYRDDLSKAVRPRRPVAEGAPATRRPALNDRPAPLVLVSEQRVDLPAEGVRPTAVIRPRRIGATSVPATEAGDDFADGAPLSPEEARNFAEFAERMGAADLAELLEAAAAYTATVEGLPHFSRPQILSKVARISEEDEYSREDGLRSFGILLRQGKIQKISRGQFTITEASRFMSEARRAAR